MILGRVVGALWCTRKHRRLERQKLLIVRPYFIYDPPHEVEQLVAVDTVDAGVGDDVVVCLGSPARWSQGEANLPVDAAVCGIVDRVQLQQEAFSARARRPLRFIGGRPPRHVEWL